MSNSSLVSYTRFSPNKTSPRNHKIDTITIHCTAGLSTLEGLGEHFAKSSTQASCNYAVDSNGKIGLYVGESDRSWCSSNRENDNRAITIEVVTSAIPPYICSEAAAKALVGLLVDICKRNNIPKILWSNDRSLCGIPERQNVTLHKWFASKDCPGDYLLGLFPNIFYEVNKRLLPSESVSRETVYGVGVEFLSKSEADHFAESLRKQGHNCFIITQEIDK